MSKNQNELYAKLRALGCAFTHYTLKRKKYFVVSLPRSGMVTSTVTLVQQYYTNAVIHEQEALRVSFKMSTRKPAKRGAKKAHILVVPLNGADSSVWTGPANEVKATLKKLNARVDVVAVKISAKEVEELK